MPTDLLQLPYELLAVLAAGYLAYRLAYTGRDPTHGNVDRLMITAFFATIARITAEVSHRYDVITPWDAVIGLTMALIAAVFWRVWGQNATSRVLSGMHISQSYPYNTAWQHLLAHDNLALVSISVRMKNGRQLMSGPLKRFVNRRLGPCILGADGSVGLFVTDIKPDADAAWKEVETDDPEWGSDMTFVSADQIAEIKIGRFG